MKKTEKRMKLNLAVSTVKVLATRHLVTVGGGISFDPEMCHTKPVATCQSMDSCKIC